MGGLRSELDPGGPGVPPTGQPQKAGDGRKSYVVQGNTYVVDDRYDLIAQVGKGSYSFVCKAKDNKTGKLVAVKKIFDVFDDLVDARRILREVVLLRYLRHPNVTTLVHIMRPRTNVKTYRDLYLVLEFMDTDLHQVIRSRQKLTEEHRKYLSYQILRALEFMHAKRVIHRDIKPGNLLVSVDSELKVCDFGLARGGVCALAHEGLDLTDYVVTRWYRPPEMLLMAKYTGGIDLWSAGCVIAEMVTRRAVFPGRDYIHQLNLITDLIGVPDSDDVSFATSSEARQFVRNMQRKDVAGALQTKLAAAHPQCFDLITKLLIFNPFKRLTASEALKHPWLADQEEMFEPAPPSGTREPDWEFDTRDVSEDNLRKLLWREMELSQDDAEDDPAAAAGAHGTSPRSSGSGSGLVGMAMSLLQRVGRGISGKHEVPQEGGAEEPAASAAAAPPTAETPPTPA
eukprot:Hpha_TRINITY_DN12470_c0_g1::TRINITY_DN12470_c0_g1_i1::g.42758::m.42758